MGQEYFINSQALQDKVGQLLPTQGGAGPGFDLSASTQIIPIIDLTEVAEGSDVRQDLQTSLSFGSVTTFFQTDVSTKTVITNTGYYRVFGNVNITQYAADFNAQFNLYNGTTSKIIQYYNVINTSGTTYQNIPFDFNVFIEPGESLRTSASYTNITIHGVYRQIADISGNLVNP